MAKALKRAPPRWFHPTRLRIRCHQNSVPVHLIAFASPWLRPTLAWHQISSGPTFDPPDESRLSQRSPDGLRARRCEREAAGQVRKEFAPLGDSSPCSAVRAASRNCLSGTGLIPLSVVCFAMIRSWRPAARCGTERRRTQFRGSSADAPNYKSQGWPGGLMRWQDCNSLLYCYRMTAKISR